VALLALVFFGGLGAVLYRAWHLQVREQAKLKGMAQDQYVRQIPIPARRGDIFDRRGIPFAQSVEVESIWVDPSELKDKKAAAKDLARVLKLDAAELFARFERARRFAWVKRQVKQEEGIAVKALGLPGLGVTREPQRFYPQRELGAHVVGISGLEGKGLEGLELAFDDELSGQTARLAGYRDARGRKLLTHGTSDPIERQGASVTLTLDRSIQHMAEKALSRAVEDAKATAGMAVVMDPRTGEILALANHPRFNPNTPKDLPRDTLRNRAALDALEPGSTFKAFVVAAALEEKTIRVDESFYCEKGRWNVGRHTVHDTHPHDTLTTRGILQVSSNICAAKVAQRLGRDRLVRYYGAFGFGEKAGLGLPGEARGIVPYPRAEIALATEAFGQGLTATAVQLAAGYATLANGGVRMKPYLVQRVVDPDGVVLLENRPTEVARVVSEKNARAVVSMLESVVEKEGTAPRARLAEYRVAGKTGTAQKVDPVAGGYSDKRLASFIGMLPAEAPRAVIAVLIDEPKTDVYGGLVAAPAFKEIAEQLMPYLGVPASTPQPVAVVPAPKMLGPAAPAVAPRENARDERLAATVPEVTERVGEGSVAVPDMTGKVGREAVAQLLGAALEPRLAGTGRVVAQSPAAGMWVEKGTQVVLTLQGRP
jgi:cell division protein FtsI (penicillin-binding protein 3)